jgi:hypothetical protein
LEELDYKEYELLVIDNHSTNDSVERLREFSPNVKIIPLQKNLGFAGGCNVGIRYALARGARYIWLLNNDTKVDSSALRAMVAIAENDSRVGAVGSIIYDMHHPQRIQAWGGGRISLWFGRSSHCTKETSVAEISYLTGASLLLRGEALEHVGLLDETFFMYWEDADLCLRLRKAGWKLAVATESRVWHKEGASLGRASSAFDVHLWTSMVHFCQQHAPWSIVPTAVATARMVIRRIVLLEWLRAARLCGAVLARFRRPTADSQYLSRIDKRDE